MQQEKLIKKQKIYFQKHLVILINGVLFRSILKKNYFTFLRKIFGTLFKFSRKCFLHIFSSKIINLDKINNKKLSKLKLNLLFINFNCAYSKC